MYSYALNISTWSYEIGTHCARITDHWVSYFVVGGPVDEQCRSCSQQSLHLLLIILRASLIQVALGLTIVFELQLFYIDSIVIIMIIEEILPDNGHAKKIK